MDNHGPFMIFETLRHKIESAYCEAQSHVLHTLDGDHAVISVIVELESRKRSALNSAMAMVRKHEA